MQSHESENISFYILTDLTTSCIIKPQKAINATSKNQCKGGYALFFSEEEQERMVDILTEELPVFRARLRVSQADIARGIGISRQTYSLIETGKQRMTWVTYMAFIAYFSRDSKTRKSLIELGLIDKNDF